jgi:hypothetical protein
MWGAFFGLDKPPVRLLMYARIVQFLALPWEYLDDQALLQALRDIGA